MILFKVEPSLYYSINHDLCLIYTLSIVDLSLSCQVIIVDRKSSHR